MMHASAQLVFIPGLAANAVMWEHQLAAAPPHLHAAVTDVHTRAPNVQAMASLLLAEHTGDLILCGASMGGMLAMEVVRQAPSRIKALALLGTMASPETPPMRKLREGAIALFEKGRAEEVLRFNLSAMFHPSRLDDPALINSYLHFVLQAGARQLIAQNRAAMDRPDARTHLAQVSCPTLVLCGANDQVAPLACSQEIVDLIPSAELAVIGQCGHMLTMERPQEVNDKLVPWLARVAPYQTRYP